jgi:hypothetical protein
MEYSYVYSFELLMFTFPGSVLGFQDVTVALPQPFPLAIGLGSFLIYVAAVLLWPKATTPAPSSNCFKTASFTHHVGLFFYSLVACLATLMHCFNSGELTSLTALNCTPAPGWLLLLALTFTASKIWEWGDTAIFLGRGQSLRKIGLLHLYHHASTFWCCLIVTSFPGSLKGGLLLNGGVHTLMYAHYAWRLPKPLRPIITISQILQLAFLTWQWHVTPQMCPQFSSYPEKHPVEFVLPYLMVPVFLVLFLKFFVDSYICPRRRAGGGEAKEE